MFDISLIYVFIHFRLEIDEQVLAEMSVLFQFLLVRYHSDDIRIGIIKSEDDLFEITIEECHQ